MSGIYLVELVAVLRAAGLEVRENAITAGWQTRARSSGGFPSTPLGVQWHHTASSTSPESDLSWMIDGSDDAPIGNLLLDRTGTYWPVAAGASNTAGKGGPLTLSRGTIPLDSGNTRSVAIEAANNGVGEPWPAVQVDAYLAGSNAINAYLGNAPGDVFTHSLGAGDGWTDRKIDPATATAVEGPWRPSSSSSSGTWLLADVRAELERRSSYTPEPTPEPEDDMTNRALIISSGGGSQPGAVAVADYTLRAKTYVSGDDAQALNATGQYDWITLDGGTFDAIPGAVAVDDIGD